MIEKTREPVWFMAGEVTQIIKQFIKKKLRRKYALLNINL